MAIRGLGWILSFLVAPLSASAGSAWTYDFSIEVEEARVAGGLDVGVGDTLDGKFTYGPSNATDGFHRSLEHVVVGLGEDIYLYEGPGVGALNIREGDDSDGMAILLSGPAGSAGTLDGVPVEASFLISLRDEQGTALTSDALPVPLPGFDEWDTTRFELRTFTPGGGSFIAGRVLSLVAPEPSTASLIALGLAALARRRRVFPSRSLEPATRRS